MWPQWWSFADVSQQGLDFSKKSVKWKYFLIWLSQITRFLVPDNTQTILTKIWHHFWLKNDGEKWSRKKILKFHSGLQRYLLTCQADSAFLGRFFCTGQQQLWRPCWNFKLIFSRPLFNIIFKPKMVSNLRKNFLCIVWPQKPTMLSNYLELYS